MRAMMPWTGMGNLKQELERFFGPFGELKLDEFPAMGDWAPSMDVSETKEALVVKAEVPGLDPNDIQISLQEQYLTIKGEKTREKMDKEERYHRVERFYGSFARSVRLPVGVDGSRVTASFKNGLLTVTLSGTRDRRPLRHIVGGPGTARAQSNEALQGVPHPQRRRSGSRRTTHIWP